MVGGQIEANASHFRAAVACDAARALEGACMAVKRANSYQRHPRFQVPSIQVGTLVVPCHCQVAWLALLSTQVPWLLHPGGSEAGSCAAALLNWE